MEEISTTINDHIYEFLERVEILFNRSTDILNKTKILQDKISKTALNSQKKIDSVTKYLDSSEKRIEMWEETLMIIYHNIRKNQFLYANYPSEWMETYEEFNKRLKEEYERNREYQKNKIPKLPC